MYISTLFPVVSLLALASASPIAGGSSTPCVSPDGWDASWVASGKQNGIFFCGESSTAGSGQPVILSSSTSTPSFSSASSSQTSSTPSSSTGLPGSGFTSPKIFASTGQGSGSNSASGSGSAARNGTSSGRPKKPCRKQKPLKSFHSVPGGSGSGTGSGSGSGSGLGVGSGSGSGGSNGGFGAGSNGQINGTSSDEQPGGAPALTLNTAVSGSSSSSVSTSTISTGSSVSTSIAASTNSAAGSIPSTGNPNNGPTTQETSTTSTTGGAGDGKTYQATITAYTGSCAQQVGACGFLGTATSFQCAMSEFWTAPGMPGQCGTCWRITNGTMANGDGTMATAKTTDITVMTTNTCAYYSGDPTGSCSQTKGAPKDRWGSDTGIDLCHDTGASKTFWGEAQDAIGGIAVATIQQVDCNLWQGDLAPQSFVDWTKYEPDGTKSLRVKPGHR